MRTMAELVRSWIRSSTSSTWAWMVTSRAVVGSSAMSTSGSLAIAMAIIARWRMPPEYSWGYSSARFGGLGMPTRSSSSTTRSRDLALAQVALVGRDRLGDLAADREDRVEGGEGVLEHHRQTGPA